MLGFSTRWPAGGMVTAAPPFHRAGPGGTFPQIPAAITVHTQMADFITGQAQAIGTFFPPSLLQMLQNSSQNSRHQCHSPLRPGSLPCPPPSPPSAHADLSTRPTQHQPGEPKGPPAQGTTEVFSLLTTSHALSGCSSHAIRPEPTVCYRSRS